MLQYSRVLLNPYIAIWWPTLPALDPRDSLLLELLAASLPLADRTPVPLTDHQGNIPPEQFRSSGGFPAAPTSFTSSQFEELFKDVDIVPEDDVLRGQGSAALGDYGARFSGDIDDQALEEEESGEEGESGEEMHSRPNSAIGHGEEVNPDLAGRGKDQVMEERAKGRLSRGGGN